MHKMRAVARASPRRFMNVFILESCGQKRTQEKMAGKILDIQPSAKRSWPTRLIYHNSAGKEEKMIRKGEDGEIHAILAK